MSVLDKLETMEIKETGLPCPMCEAIKSMDPEDQINVESWLFEVPRRRTNIQVLNAFKAENHQVTYSSVSQHRRKECRGFIKKDAHTLSKAK